MNRLAKNSKYENRYLLTEEISYDPKTGNQVWAVTDSETEKRLIGRFQGNGKVEWFDDTRPKTKANAIKIEEKLPNILPSIGTVSKSTEKITSISSLSNSQSSKQVERSQPFAIPQSNQKNTTSNTIRSFDTPKIENQLKPQPKSKLPLYIGLSFLGLCLALIGYYKREIILSKINQPKIEETKVDSTVNIIQEKEVIATPNLPKIDIEKPTKEITDTLKPNTDLQVKINKLENKNPPKEVKKKRVEKTPKNGGFIRL
jgi:hypothetical protein